MTRKTWLISLVLICLMLFAACSPTPTHPTPPAKLPNPASVHCKQNGGKLALRQDAAGGVAGMCVFPNGSECEEWAYFRGECKPKNSPVSPIPTPSPESSSSNPASVYCEQQGNQLKIVTADDGSQEGVCIFPMAARVMSGRISMASVSRQTE